MENKYFHKRMILPIFLLMLVFSVLLFLSNPEIRSENTSGALKNYVIIVPARPGPVVQYAAEELQQFMEQVFGSKLQIMEETALPVNSKYFSVGDTANSVQAITNGEAEEIGEEGYVVREKDGNLYIRGLTPRGTLYGVYSFLEDRIGVRWFAPGATVIPKKESLDIGKMDYSGKPAFEYRESFFHQAFDGDWAARNRQNGQSYRFSEKHGGKVEYVGGFVHTFSSLVPPDKYFKDHPEYYAEIDGVRTQNSQLCLTNPDVLDIVTKRVLEIAESTGGMRAIISVSQNDNMMYCKCPKCVAVDSAEETPMGTLLRFVNEVAKKVGGKYPNIAIDTLAYQYSETPPKNVKPLDNVIIRLCHMAPSCDTHPLGKCFWNEKYVKNLKAWNRLTDRIYVWHYVTNFTHYLAPFPDLNAIEKDMAFYHNNHVKGLFAQGSYQSNGGDLAELKAWLIAKLLWNPGADPEALMKEFIEGYYGPAAPAVKEYIGMQRKHVRKYTMHAHLYSSPSGGHLDRALLADMDKALAKAEALAAPDPQYSERVRMMRAGYIYTQLAAPDLFFDNLSSPETKKILQGLFDKFSVELKRLDITRLHEIETPETTLERFRQRMELEKAQ